MLAGRTRGLARAECIVADPEFCTDDADNETGNPTAQQ